MVKSICSRRSSQWTCAKVVASTAIRVVAVGQASMTAGWGASSSSVTSASYTLDLYRVSSVGSIQKFPHMDTEESRKNTEFFIYVKIVILRLKHNTMPLHDKPSTLGIGGYE